jgi:hypothetical protein
MGNVARVGGAIASVIALAVGLLGLVPSWPKWLLIALGVAGLIAIVVQFFWERRGARASAAADAGGQQVGDVRQTQTGGPSSQNWQAGRDIRVEGGMGNSVE